MITKCDGCKQYLQLLEQNGKLTNHQRKKFLDEILKHDFTCVQKQQLILGEKEDVDFWTYADTKLSCLAMERKRCELRKEGIDNDE